MSGSADGSTKGRLLVAAPALIDPNFFRTVVLMVEHTEDGAAGVVINRPTDVELAGGPLEEWTDLAASPPLVFEGGPVSREHAICLARVYPNTALDSWQPVVGGVGVVDLGAEQHTLRTALDQVRVFSGYAGWGPGQLEAEIDEGAWFVLDADPNDALSTEPGGLWRTVLKRQGGSLALVASFPPDPNMN
jgi:putative transcriptional regulator